MDLYSSQQLSYRVGHLFPGLRVCLIPISQLHGLPCSDAGLGGAVFWFRVAGWRPITLTGLGGMFSGRFPQTCLQ